MGWSAGWGSSQSAERTGRHPALQRKALLESFERPEVARSTELRSRMVAITLPSKLEEAVTEEATMKGTTAELLALDVLLEHFLKPSSVKQLPEGATLADALVDYIGAVNTRDKYPEGSTLSESTGHEFAQLMLEKRKQGKL